MMRPLRVRNEEPNQPSAGGKRSSSGTARYRSSSENRQSGINSRQSTGRASTGRNSGIPTLGRQSMGRPSVGRQSFSRPSIGVQSGLMAPKYGSTRMTFGQTSQRHSSIGGRGRTNIPKECRPLSDKNYQQKCIRKLCDFLLKNGYPCPISPKVLQSPTNKEFYKLFEFIYSFLVPGVKIKKPDEEIPNFFKMLGYPVTITKSSMFAVGSPHTWAGLLAALVWLMELVTYAEELENEDNYLFPPAEDFDSISEDKMLYIYIEQTYAAYLAGEDEFDDYDRSLSQAIKAKFCGGSSSGDPLADIQRLQLELEQLEQNSDLLGILRQKKAVCESDTQSMTDYLKKMEIHLKKQQNRLKEEEEETTGLRTKLEALSQKFENMQIICENQTLTQADIQRVNMLRKDLQNQIDCRESESEELDKEIWKLETDMAKSREKLEGISRVYNSLAHSLKLIPVTGENARGLDYEMKTTHQSTMRDEMENIKKYLTDFKKRCNTALHETESESLNQLSELEMIKEAKNEAIEENNSLEKKLKKEKEDMEALRKINSRELQIIQEEIESEQNLITGFQEMSHLGYQEALKDLRETQKSAEERCVELDKMERLAMDKLNKLMELVIQHLQDQQNELKNYTTVSEEIVKRLEHTNKPV